MRFRKRLPVTWLIGALQIAEKAVPTKDCSVTHGADDLKGRELL
jgi:hypothetical protein